jgi:hypothetical protein
MLFAAETLALRQCSGDGDRACRALAAVLLREREPGGGGINTLERRHNAVQQAQDFEKNVTCGQLLCNRLDPILCERALLP